MSQQGVAAGAGLLELYEQMLLIREAELRIAALFADGAIPGFIHLSVGQEAVAVGLGAALAPDDTIAFTHRGHGHAIAKGVELERFFLELMGRQEGICSGRGGSMHIADLSVGMLGANGIVGAGIPIALGSAMAHQVKGRAAIAVACFGDGALAEGVLHESLNLAALWKLPMLLLCENNGWSEFSPSSRQFVAEPCKLAETFGIPAVQVDGGDVEAVRDAAVFAVQALRAGNGPQFLECITHRIRGHYEGDPQKYREESNQAQAHADDPLVRTAALLTAEQLAEIKTRVVAQVEAAVAGAQKGTEPTLAAALAEVYTETGASHV